MKRLLAALALVSAVGLSVHAATLSRYTVIDPSSPVSNFNNIVDSINSGVTPESMASWSPFRNYLDNGAIAVSQRGTAATAGGTTTCNANYVADRWCVNTNVALGAGYGQVVTSSPAPLPGFQNSMKVYRNSGTLTQPVCTNQEVATSRATQLQGRSVILSSYLQALAGMSGTGIVTGYIWTGTGSDQGLGTFTASPAVTPAFTGLATAGSFTATLPLTSPAWARYNSAAIAIPLTATEIAVGFCFTPGASGAGATDGFAMAGVQLEAVGANSAAPSPFQFLPYPVDLAAAQVTFWQLNEPALGAVVGICQATGAAAQSCEITTPVTMRAAPTVAITTGTFKENIAGVATTWVTPTAGTSTVNMLNITTGNTTTAGQALLLTGGGGTGVVTATADF